MFRRSRDVTMLPIVCLVLMALSACASNSGSEATPAPTPLAPMAGLPAQPPVITNLNQQIVGNWSASYPGGPYRVTIQTDPLLGRTNYIATLIDGGYGTFSPGSIVFKATPDGVVPNLVTGTQKCPDPGYAGPFDVSMTITVVDANNLNEDLVQKGACKGYPVKFTRTAASP
jgi:hypothetical protein